MRGEYVESHMRFRRALEGLGFSVSDYARDGLHGVIGLRDGRSGPRSVPYRFYPSASPRFTVHKELGTLGDVLVAYAWRSPQERFFLMGYDEALRILGDKALRTRSWLSDGWYTIPNPQRERLREIEAREVGSERAKWLRDRLGGGHPHAAAATRARTAPGGVPVVAKAAPEPPSLESWKGLSKEDQEAASRSLRLYASFARTRKPEFAPAFQPLFGPLESAADAELVSRLRESVPDSTQRRDAWFRPALKGVDGGARAYFQGLGKRLEELLVFGRPDAPLGLLRACLEHAQRDRRKFGGVFEAVKRRFNEVADSDLLAHVERVSKLRNAIAHSREELSSPLEAESAMRDWIELLARLRS